MLPLSDVQKALYEALTAALAPVPVLDSAGPDQLYPYVTIGEQSATPVDLLDSDGTDLDITIHIWSRQPGMEEIQKLMRRAKDALHYKTFPTSTEWQWVQTIWTFAQTLRDIDGITRHGVMRFRVMAFSPASVGSQQ